MNGFATAQASHQERRAAPPPADLPHGGYKIIAEGDRKRVEYRRANPDADTAMVFGAQIAHLHDAVLRLYDELQAHAPQYRRDLYHYIDLYVTELGGKVCCGYDFEEEDEPDDTSRSVFAPSPAICVTLEQVWAGGRDISAGISEEVARQIIDRINELVRAKAREVDGAE